MVPLVGFSDGFWITLGLVFLLLSCCGEMFSYVILVGLMGRESCMRLTSILPSAIGLTIVPIQVFLEGMTEKVIIFFVGGVSIDWV